MADKRKLGSGEKKFRDRSQNYKSSRNVHSNIKRKRVLTEEEKQEVFRQVATKVQWLEGNKEAVLQFLLKNEEVRELFEVAQEDLEEEITEEQFCEAVYFYDLYCEVGEDLVCTFDVDTDPDYFLGHLVNIRLDDNYRLHLETISG